MSAAPRSAMPQWLSACDAWLRGLNRRRLQRRRQRQQRHAERAWFAREDPARPEVAEALIARFNALQSPAMLSVLMRPAATPGSMAAGWPWHGGAPLAGAWEAPPGNGSTDQPAHESFNRALHEARGDVVAVLPPGMLLAAHAGVLIAEAMVRLPNCVVLYGDEDAIDGTGARHAPLLRCDWNAELLRSTHYLDGVVVARRDAWLAAGGLRPGSLDAAWWDLLLRLTERLEPAQVVHIPHVIAHQRADRPLSRRVPVASASAEEVAAVQAHLDRRRVSATARGAAEGGVHVTYAVPTDAPLVSLIVPTRNGLQLLRQCVQSILERTTYARYELVIVDNGSDDAATLSYLRQLARNPRVRVHRDERPFNFAALNNAAVPLCRGSVLGLVNNDIEVITPGWLDEMVGLAMRADVGAVGARLWFGNGTLQHAGVVLGIGGVAAHLHQRLPRDDPGYLGRARVTQEFSAVTAACMVLRRDLFEQVGGFDEATFAVDFNDIDLCLRIRTAGYRIVCTPHAELYHHESATRGANVRPVQRARHAREFAAMRERWSAWLDHDPAYNANASLKNRDFEFAIADQPRVSLVHPWYERGVQRGQAAAIAGSLSMKNSTS
jgi:GT2 family glycosyltransferase